MVNDNFLISMKTLRTLNQFNIRNHFQHYLRVILNFNEIGFQSCRFFSAL